MERIELEGEGAERAAEILERRGKAKRVSADTDTLTIWLCDEHGKVSPIFGAGGRYHYIEGRALNAPSYCHSPTLREVEVVRVGAVGSVPAVARLVEAGKILRFWMNKLASESEVYGEEMDAPVVLPKLEAVELTSLKSFVRRYDEALAALREGER